MKKLVYHGMLTRGHRMLARGRTPLICRASSPFLDRRDRKQLQAEERNAVQNWAWKLASTKEIPAFDPQTLQNCPIELVSTLDYARVLYGQPPLTPARRIAFRRAMLPFLNSHDEKQVAFVEQMLIYWGCL